MNKDQIEGQFSQETETLELQAEMKAFFDKNPELATKIDFSEFVKKYKLTYENIQRLCKLNFGLVLDKTLQVKAGKLGEGNSFDSKNIAIILDPLEIILNNYSYEEILWLVAKQQSEFLEHFGNYKQRTENNLQIFEQRILENQELAGIYQLETSEVLNNCLEDLPPNYEGKKEIEDLVDKSFGALRETLDEIYHNQDIETRIPRLKKQQTLKNLYLKNIPEGLDFQPKHLQLLYAIRWISAGMDLQNLPISENLRTKLDQQIYVRNQFGNEQAITLAQFIANSVIPNKNKGNRLNRYFWQTQIRELFSGFLKSDINLSRDFSQNLAENQPEISPDSDSGDGSSDSGEKPQNKSSNPDNQGENDSESPTNSGQSNPDSDKGNKKSDNGEKPQNKSSNPDNQGENDSESPTNSGQSNPDSDKKTKSESPRGEDGGGSLSNKDIAYEEDDSTPHTGDINDSEQQTQQETYGGDTQVEGDQEHYGQTDDSTDKPEAVNPNSEQDKENKHETGEQNQKLYESKQNSQENPEIAETSNNSDEQSQQRPAQNSGKKSKNSDTEEKPSENPSSSNSENSAEAKNSSSGNSTNSNNTSENKGFHSQTKTKTEFTLAQIRDSLENFWEKHPRLNSENAPFQNTSMGEKFQEELRNLMRYTKDQADIKEEALKIISDHKSDSYTGPFEDWSTKTMNLWFEKNMVRIDQQAMDIAKSWLEILGKDSGKTTYERRGVNSSKPGKLEIKSLIKQYPAIQAGNLDSQVYSKKVSSFEKERPKEINISLLFDTSGSMANNFSELLVLVMIFFRSTEFFYKFQTNNKALKNPTELKVEFYSYNQESKHMGTFTAEDFVNPEKTRLRFIQEVFAELDITSGNRPAKAYERILGQVKTEQNSKGLRRIIMDVTDGGIYPSDGLARVGDCLKQLVEFSNVSILSLQIPAAKGHQEQHKKLWSPLLGPNVAIYGLEGRNGEFKIEKISSIMTKFVIDNLQ